MAKHINAGSFVNLSITDLQKTYELPSIRTPHTKHSHLIKHALAGITITLAPGLYGLLGPNGAPFPSKNEPSTSSRDTGWPPSW